MSIYSLTPKQDAELHKRLWRIHTTHKVTQEAITAHLSQTGKSEEEYCVEMYYGTRKLSAFVVDWEIVKFLTRNKAMNGYSFEAYYKAYSSDQWHVWKEGHKSPGEFLSKTFVGRNIPPDKKNPKPKRVRART